MHFRVDTPFSDEFNRTISLETTSHRSRKDASLELRVCRRTYTRTRKKRRGRGGGWNEERRQGFGPSPKEETLDPKRRWRRWELPKRKEAVETGPDP